MDTHSTATDSAAVNEAVVFLRYFKDLHDPRQPGKVCCPLDEILLLCLLAVLGGAECFTEIALFGVKKRDLLRRFRPFKDGTPAHDHLGDILAVPDAGQFQRCFAAWVAGVTGMSRGVIAIDGKSVRRSAGKSGKAAVHVVSASAAHRRLVLGQVKVAEKSNEIVAIPKILDMPAVEGTVITIDAVGCQRGIAQKVMDKKADYVLALKGNRGSLQADVELFVAEQKAKDIADTKVSTSKSTDGDHGRIETRVTTVLHDVGWLQKRHGWPGLKAVVVVDSSRETNGRTERETRLYITSLAFPACLTGLSSAATGRSRTACTGSWTWSSAMANAASGRITRPPISRRSSTWRTTCCGTLRARVRYAPGARRQAGMTTFWPASSRDNLFTRFLCFH